MPEERPDTTVEVVAYDESWPQSFADEQARILAALPSLEVVEHIGSTAVPGLPAKPTIDLLAVVPDEQLHTAAPAFCRIGYLHVPQSFADDPQHLFFHRLRAGKRTHHLHVLAASSPLVARYLVFRDYLRAHPDEALRYATFKQDLAVEHAHERDGYVEAKPPFVDAMIERAWQWRPLA